jgi:hypothetical protein
MKELVQIQAELKAPKNQENKFGGYKYRSAEDILEAAKKVMCKYNCYLTVSDNIEMVGSRVYVTATATLTNAEGKSVSTKAYAREEETKKGMDAAQITGSASSYARKYALNGLFCIDDTKDPDATNTHGQEVVRVSGKELMGQVPAQSVKDVFAACADRPALVKAWNKYKGTTQEGEAKEALRVRKQELNIE